MGYFKRKKSGTKKDSDLNSMFETSTLLDKSHGRIPPHIAPKALKTLVLFLTTYLCEMEFSAVTAAKTKLRSRLSIRNTLRVSLSPIVNTRETTSGLSLIIFTKYHRFCVFRITLFWCIFPPRLAMEDMKRVCGAKKVWDHFFLIF